jgi:membrane-bound serine protease (ClpP class)
LALVLLAALWFVAPSATAQSGPVAGGGATVLVIPITGTIDLGLAPYLSRVLDEAAAVGAATVVLRIDTPGGRLDAVLQMRDALLASRVRTIAFVDRTAFSAGALLALAANDIFMTPGAAMGAATPIDGTTGETASEKTVSAVRTTFKATAEARGRDPLVAEAMVDPDVAIDGLVAGGELLTLTTNEAVAWGYADGVADDLAGVLAASGLAEARLVETSPSLAERVVRFVTDPVAASLLIILAVLLIVGDFFVEGFGFAGAAGLGLLALFFWGHLLAGLTGWEDIALVGLGLALIAVEVFVVPGFGIPGVLGLVALLGGLFLAMLGREIQTPEGIERAGLTVVASLLAIVVGIVALLALLPRRRRFGGLVLQAAVGDGAPALPPAPVPGRRGGLAWFGGAANPTRAAPRVTPPAAPVGRPPDRSIGGATGVALSDLRPSGIADIGGQRVDVVSAGDYIAAGQPIEVVLDEGYRRVVRRVPS